MHLITEGFGPTLIRVLCLSASLGCVACFDGDEKSDNNDNTAGDTGGSGNSDGGSGGAGASGGSGASGTGGSGDAGGGSGGSDATGGSSGSSGASGTAGVGGSGGSDGGSAGVGGSGGSDGGSAGVGGSGGSDGGSAGVGGSGGSDGGSAGVGGSSGSSGSGGSGGVPCDDVTDCDDGLFCTGAETCTPGGFCQAGDAVECPNVDGVSCTVETCNETDDTCTLVYQDLACSNDLFCDGIETCSPKATGANPTTGCLSGQPIVCTDGATCTSDSCNEASDRCFFAPDNSKCNGALFCAGMEVCAPGDPSANGTTGCTKAVPPDCDDDVDCTADSCNEPANKCDHIPNHAGCGDGLYCNGEEVCDTSLGCKAGPPIDCPVDTFDCTVEGCDEVDNACETVLDNTQCTLDEPFCEPGFGCVAGLPCDDNDDCLDDDLCNGGEFCDLTVRLPAGGPLPGVCRPGTPTVCDDEKECTVDSCTEATGVCVFAPQDALCNDVSVCTGTETCDPADGSADADTGCVAGTPLDCADEFECTSNDCNAITGCENPPDNAECDDGLVCNGAEICNPTLPDHDPGTGCNVGTAPECSGDGIDCTAELCVEAAGGCRAVPDNGECACGETCDPSQGGCGRFCTVRQCQGKTYQCGDCIDNDSDCKIDSTDEHCLGACHNTETSFHGDIPGQNNAPCKSDCYFDGDTGSGNDQCYWSHKCDILEVSPNYDPEGNKCEYTGTPGVLPPDSDANIPGTGESCAELYVTQLNACGTYCGPLTPNGCDCFGCCAFDELDYTVWLNSENSSGQPCTLDVLTNTTRCRPCTQVIACLNTCEHCEICIGKPDLPPECTEQQCPPGKQKCGLPGQAECPSNQYCVTGCCQPLPS